MADSKKEAKQAGTAELITEAWRSADNAIVNTIIAAKALETLRTQVMASVLDLSGGADCDMDTFYVFVEGILSTIGEAGRETNRASKLLAKVRTSEA